MDPLTILWMAVIYAVVVSITARTYYLYRQDMRPPNLDEIQDMHLSTHSEATEAIRSHTEYSKETSDKISIILTFPISIPFLAILWVIEHLLSGMYKVVIDIPSGVIFNIIKGVLNDKRL